MRWDREDFTQDLWPQLTDCGALVSTMFLKFNGMEDIAVAMQRHISWGSRLMINNHFQIATSGFMFRRYSEVALMGKGASKSGYLRGRERVGM